MANERLRAALLQSGLSVAALAEEIGVDPKTVERWITQNRVPYRKHRFAVATRLGQDEIYLWPDALPQDQVAEASQSEIVSIYPHRWAVPRETWGKLFESAEREIGFLVYVGLFLAEDSGVQKILRDKAAAGVRVRVLLGDPESAAVAQRGEDEGIGDAVATKVRNALVLYRPLIASDGAEFRMHTRTVGRSHAAPGTRSSSRPKQKSASSPTPPSSLPRTPASSAPSPTAPTTASPSGSCSATPTAHGSENEAKKRVSALQSRPRFTTS
jgi:transcriptional regulator with XRE-family HTH domain